MSRAWLVAITVIGLLGAAPARAQLGAELLKLYGGTYQSKCEDPRAPKVTVFDNAVVFLDGDRRVASANLQAQHSFFGNSAPEGYMVALVSEVGAEQLYCLVYQDAGGMYLKVDGDAGAMAKIGKAAGGLVYRRCDGAGKPAESAAPAKPAAKSSSPVGMTASALLDDPVFVAAYRKALGPLVREPWLKDLDGPSSESRLVKIAGVEYVLANACQNHDCGDQNVVLIYSKARRAVFGRVNQNGRPTLIGAPSPAVEKELYRLWRAQWRSAP